MAGARVSAGLASAVYAGWVRHRRYVPRAHAFRYRLFMMYLDLAEIERAFASRWLWSVNRRNLAEFRRSDYLGAAGVPLDQAVRDRVEHCSGRRPRGPIRLLTHLRYFGCAFNPVSFYYCFRDDGRTLDSIVAEVTNTPWRERHAYVLPIERARHRGTVEEWCFDKALHVSPFLPMQREYRWRFQNPGASVRVHMDVLDRGRPEFDATLVLERRPLDGPNLARCLMRFPWMTARVLAAIHWQAARLWLKRTPVHNHPRTLEERP
jgi:hypothetical protein